MAGFWGAFFGTAALMLTASIAAYARSRQRVALLSAFAALVSAFFVLMFLGGLPLGEPATQARWLAHVAVVSAGILGLMLFTLLGLTKRPATRLRAMKFMLGTSAAVLGAGWALDAHAGLALACTMAFSVAVLALVASIRSALRGDRLAWAAVFGVGFMTIALAGLSWMALVPDPPWTLHAVSAGAGVAYLATMAYAMWSRYAYLMELSEVLARGYDPVTRLRSLSETGQMMGAAFERRDGDRRAVGVVVVSIANLYVLDNLHGRAAYNHALFVCASRLRRLLPEEVELGRLSDDGFLLLVRDARDMELLVAMARLVRERLTKAVVLNTSIDRPSQDVRATWVAEVGLGVLVAGPQMRASQALMTARAMSRTAWSFPSRLAWLDEVRGRIAELPLADAA